MQKKGRIVSDSVRQRLFLLRLGKRIGVRLACESMDHGSIALNIHVFVFDAPPKPLVENIVEGPASGIHTDFDPLFYQSSRKFFAGKLAALVRIENIGRPLL